MSLRVRVLLALVLALLASSAVGTSLAGWRARQALREELDAAMAGGRQAVTRAYEDLPRSDHAPHDLRLLVGTFDGNRHLRARLVAADGRVVAASQPAAALGAPSWFGAQLRVAPPAVALPPPIPGYRALVLQADPLPDTSVLWAQFQALMLALGAVLAVGAVLAWLMVGRALRPLANLSAAFERIGSGDYRPSVRAEGPAEIARLGRAVNEMTARLAEVQARNRALEEHILTLQDEERADLARDLHDEMGPHLFAVNVDAAMAGRLVEDGRGAEAKARIAAIQAGVAHVQRLVREILSRLRPTPLVEMGLSAAVHDLVAFWRGRRADIAFAVALPAEEPEMGEAAREAIYRMVQEGLVNAVRHGRPSRIEIEIALGAGGWIGARIADDGAASGTPDEGGLGLVGMRERIEQAGGRLSAGPGPDGRGWVLSARLPRAGEAGLAA